MKNRIVALLIPMLLCASAAYSQETLAVTEDGRKVLLNSNGSWRPFGSTAPVAPSPAKSPFQKAAGASSVYKSKGDKFQVWYNPSKWHQKKSAENDKPTFEHKDGDIYAMILAERFSMTLDALKDLAIQNAQNVAPDVRVTHEEERVVNGKKILCMSFEGTISGVPFTYFGYYYAGKNGIIQLITYTAQNLFEEYRGEMTEFLNGLKIND